MEDSKKDKYKKSQTKDKTKVTKKDNAWPGQTVKEQVDKVKKTNSKARAINDYKKVTGQEPDRNQDRKAFRINNNKPGRPESTAPKYKAEAGSGSVPSGTNTNLPSNYGKRKDGSYGSC